jgi:hypothetical protein
MASDNELQIVLTLIDNASAELKKVTGGVSEDMKKVKNSSEEAGKSIKEQFKEAGSELKDFRRSALLVTAALATIISTTKEAAKYSKEAKESYDAFSVSIQTLSVTLGQMLAPALDGVSFIVRILTDTIAAAVGGFIKLGSFIVEFFSNLTSGPVEAYRIAMETANMATDNFLNKIEESRARVATGLTFDKEMANIINLEKITVKSNQMMKTSWQGVISATQQLGVALAGAEEMGRGFAVAAAAVAIAMAIVNTAQGITLALATYVWPYSMIVAGIIGAAGAIQVATIASQKFADGGRPPVGVPSLVGERGPELFIPDGFGTIIPNHRLGGGGNQTSINIEVNYPMVRSDDDIDRLTEEISLRLAREAERL